MNTSEVGRWAEHVAAWYLEERGWVVLSRNFRSGRSEIDLVAMRDGVVAFVEVRARRRTDFGHPFDTIGRRKQQALEKAAHAWINEHGSPGLDYRFDAAAVTRAPDGSAVIEVLEDAWSSQP